MDTNVNVNDENVFYRVLEPGHIRILKWQSSPGDLSFQMVHACLRKKPRYAALSYAWGDDKLCRQIRINGFPFWIAENLFLALSQFLKGLESKNSSFPLKQPFLIDAVCIRQNLSPQALRERGLQVSMMTEIYEQASRVFVWLGPADNEDQNRACAAKLKELERAYLDDVGRLFPYRPWWWPVRPVDTLALVNRVHVDRGQKEAAQWRSTGVENKNAWYGIIHLWSSTYWTRAWAYQEGTVREAMAAFFIKCMRLRAPKARVKFISGNTCTTWNRLILAFAVTESLISSNAPGTERLRGSARHFYRVWHVRALRSSRELGDILKILSDFRYASCKDPRDKIYAALGLVAKTKRAISPDYQAPPVHVYTQLVASMLISPQKNMDFLGYTCLSPLSNDSVSFQGKEEKLPSWVPNWQSPLPITPIPKTIYLQAPAAKHRSLRPIDKRLVTIEQTESEIPAFKACGRFQTINTVVNDYQLRTSGAFVDTVSETILNSWADVVRTESAERWKLLLVESTYSSGDEFEAALRQTQCFDVKQLTTMGSKAVSRGYEIDNNLLRRNQAGMSDSDRVAQSTMRNTLTVCTRLRAVGLTQGNRQAMVPESSQAGDKICMMFGGQVLYVLRRKSDGGSSYEYIGEAYIHGLMDGEVDRMIDKDECLIETIVIE